MAALVAAYFLVATRGSLVIQSLKGKKGPASHVYWLYSNRYLIWLTDRQPVISAILLFNYHRLVSDVVRRMNPGLKGKRVLHASCAFGDFTEKVALKCASEGAERLVLVDLIPNEIKHAKNKLKRVPGKARRSFAIGDVVNIAHKDTTFDYVMMFFLFHELPYEKKIAALREANRVLKPGGKIIFGEFHKPGPLILKISGLLFFLVMEPFAREMWEKFEPETVLNGAYPEGWEFSRQTYFFGNYQVFSALKK